MKWITHQTGALAAALLFQADAITCAGMVAGAILPDSVEMGITGGNKRLFLKIHRGIFHWFGLYVGGIVLAGLLPLSPYIYLSVVGLMLGALTHIIMDALNPTGVPLLPFFPTPKLKLPLVSTGTMGEWLVLCALFVLIGFCWNKLEAGWLNSLLRFFK